MLAPQMRPEMSKRSSTNLPNREELSLRDVLAFPNASSKGLDSNTYQARFQSNILKYKDSLD